MRITNKMMTNNAMANINRNKNKMNIVSNQKATGLKIQRASEDPIVAVRALRFRANVSQLNQYYEKNIPDAFDWMAVTESALGAMNDAISQMNTKCSEAGTGTKNVYDCLAIVQELKELQEEVYKQGNSDYAGRYVFAGYKTDTPLLFQDKETDLVYDITQNMSSADFESYSFVDNSVINSKYDEQTEYPTLGNAHRIRLAYEELDSGKISISYRTEDAPVALKALNDAEKVLSDAEREVLKDKFSGYNSSVEMNNLVSSYFDTIRNGGDPATARTSLETDLLAAATAAGDTLTTADINSKLSAYNTALMTKNTAQTTYDNTYVTHSTITSVSINDPDAYKVGPDEIRLIPETGEVIFGDNVYEDMRYSNNIDISYTKSSFLKGELRPEHYFECTSTDYSENPPKVVKFLKENQEIQYEINFGQKLTVNTQADSAFTQDIARDIDDLMRSVQDAIAAQENIDSIKKMIDDPMYSSQDDQEKLAKMLDKAEIEFTLKQDLMYKNFQQKITTTKEHQEKASIAQSNLGSRWNRLELTENRLSSQQVDFEELLSNNEEVDIADVLVKYTSLDAIYSASLSVGAKVVKNTLLDFI